MFTKENLAAANAALSSIPYERRDKKTGQTTSTPYVQVNERVKAFRDICPNGSITTTIISIGNGVVTMMAEVKDEAGNVIATGMAQEKESSSFINKTSYIENCETSAVGRALGFAGIGIDGSMASADELANAINNQNKPAEKTTAKKTAKPKETPQEEQPEVEDRTGEPAYPPVNEMIGLINQRADKNKVLDEWLSNAIGAAGCRDLNELAEKNPAAIKAWYQKLFQKG